MLGFQSDFTLDRYYIANFKPQFNRAYSDMYVYSDIVRSSFVGGLLSLLQKSFHIRKSHNFGEELSFELTHSSYIDVAKSSLNQIVTYIRDSKGNKIPFDDSAITTLTLHFKQV